MSQQTKIGTHKTSVFTENGITKIVYHSTPVVSFNDKEIILNTGGYFTNTTKSRMNQASNQFDLGYSVYQKNWDWFVDYKGETIEFNGYRVYLPR